MLGKNTDQVLAMMEVLAIPAVVHKDEFASGVQWRVRPIVEKLDENLPVPRWTEVPAAEMQAAQKPQVDDLERTVREQTKQIQRLEWLIKSVTEGAKESGCKCERPTALHHPQAPTYKGKKYYVSKGRLFKYLQKEFGMSALEFTALCPSMPCRPVRDGGSRFEYCMPVVSAWVKASKPEYSGFNGLIACDKREHADIHSTRINTQLGDLVNLGGTLITPLLFGAGGQSLLKGVDSPRYLTPKRGADGNLFYSWPKSMELKEKLFIRKADLLGKHSQVRDKAHMWAWRKGYTVGIFRKDGDVVVRRDK